MVFKNVPPNSRVHVEVVHFVRGSSIVSLSHNRNILFCPCEKRTCRNYIAISFFQLQDSLNFLKYLKLQVSPRHFCKQQTFLLLHPHECSKTQIQKISTSLILLCCDRFFSAFIHHPVKVYIFHLHLKTRRCVGFGISCHPACKFPWSYELPHPFGCNRIFRGWRTCPNMWRQVHSCRSWFCHKSFFVLLFLHPLRHLFGATCQAGILSAASGAEMAAVEQMKKIVAFVTCEVTFGQKMSATWCLATIYRIWIFRIKINPVKQPIQSNSVGSWHMSHCGTSAFDNHLNHGFILLKDTQHSIGTRMCSAWWNVINIVSDRDWCSWLEFVFACLTE